MAHRSQENLDAKVFVGGLRDDVRKGEIEDAFQRFGTIRSVWIARKPPGFAFVFFDDERDAKEAVHELDGTLIGGSKVKVELSHGRSKRDRGGRFDNEDRGYGRRYNDRGRDYDRNRRYSRSPYSRRRRSRSPYSRRSRSPRDLKRDDRDRSYSPPRDDRRESQRSISPHRSYSPPRDGMESKRSASPPDYQKDRSEASPRRSHSGSP